MVKADKANTFFNLQHDNELELRLSIASAFEVLINKRLRLHGLPCSSSCTTVYISTSAYKPEAFADSVYINPVVSNNPLKDLSPNSSRRSYILHLGPDFGCVAMHCEKQLARLSKTTTCTVLSISKIFVTCVKGHKVMAALCDNRSTVKILINVATYSMKTVFIKHLQSYLNVHDCTYSPVLH